MLSIIWYTESEERKAALYQEVTELLTDIVRNSEDHFGAYNNEVGSPLFCMMA
jgi:hypothetical protein